MVVGDDVALPDWRKARGLAGTLFVHKIAGALAEQGVALETIQAIGNHVAKNVKTLGVSFSNCSQPWQTDCRHLDAGIMEVHFAPCFGSPSRLS